jgi:hypothetical protein
MEVCRITRSTYLQLCGLLVSGRQRLNFRLLLLMGMNVLPFPDSLWLVVDSASSRACHCIAA